LCNVIVVFAVLRSRLGVEKVVARNELEYLPELSVDRFGYNEEECDFQTDHASHTPDICARTPLRPQDDLWRAVLSCLNIVGEMVTDPARVPQVGNLH
jgi:hypothetical protein